MSYGRTRYRYDADLDAVVEIRGNYFEEAPQGPSVITDDIGAGVNGLRHMADGKHYDSKSRFRAETRAHGMVEVGDQNPIAKPPEKPKDYYGQQVRDASAQIAGNWNGTADWLRRQNERR